MQFSNAEVNAARVGAKAGDAESQFLLAMFYRDGKNGRGGDRDLEKMSPWLRAAAGQGHTEAQYELGWQYYNGHIRPYISRDEGREAEAKNWWKTAADAGHGLAKICLENIIERGCPLTNPKGDQQ